MALEGPVVVSLKVSRVLLRVGLVDVKTLDFFLGRPSDLVMSISFLRRIEVRCVSEV